MGVLNIRGNIPLGFFGIMKFVYDRGVMENSLFREKIFQKTFLEY